MCPLQKGQNHQLKENSPFSFSYQFKANIYHNLESSQNPVWNKIISPWNNLQMPFHQIHKSPSSYRFYI